MSIATDVRAYAGLALDQGKSALSQAGAVVTNANKRLAADAPKPVLAALGAADLVAETLGKRAGAVGKRVESLPAEAAGNVAKAQETGKVLLSRTQDDALARITELRDLLDTGLESVKSLQAVPVAAAQSTSGYLDTAKQAYDALTARGEAKLADLRKDLRLTRLLGDLDEASSAIQARLAPVLGSVRSEVVPYLDSAFDAIKDADLGEPAAASQTSRRRTATGRRTAPSTARKSTASTRSAAGSRAKSADSATRTPAAKRAASATRTPAAKRAASTTTRTPAAKRTASTTRTAPAKRAASTRTAAAKKA